MNHLVKISLLLTLLLPANAVAYDFEVDGMYYNLSSDGASAIVTYRGEYYYQYGNTYTGDVSIPSSVTFNGTSYPVTAIGDHAFFACHDLTNVIIPNSIIQIGECAFGRCGSLTSMTIPNSVTSIGMSPFHYCDELNKISVESGNSTYDSRNNCNAIIESSSNTLIVGCKNTIIPNTVTSIGKGAFQHVINLITVEIPNSVINIDRHAFYGCTGLAEVIIPNTVTKIGVYAFYSCTSLTEITIPNSVISIGDRAFKDCCGLTSVTIESKACSDGVFQGCFAINTVTVRRAVPPDITDGFFDEDIYQYATLHVPTGRTLFFRDHDVWNKFATIVEDDMPDVETNFNPFEDLNSKRLIIGYSRNDAGGSSGISARDDHQPDHIVTAIKLPAERMARIQGNKITHIRFSMLHTDVSDMKVWIGSSRDKRDLVWQDVSNLQTGWNDITLDQPYTITGDSIIVGVEFNLEYYKLIPVKWAPYDGEEDGTFLCFKSDQWDTLYGSHYIQCLVEGDGIPEYDIHLVKVGQLNSYFLYSNPIKRGEQAFYSLTMRNWGSKIIRSNEIEMLGLLDGEDIEISPLYTQTFNNNPGLQEFYILATPSMNTPIGSHQLTLFPKSLKGVEYHSTDSPMQAKLRVYEHDMGRQKVLIQNYNGTWCGYCPEFESLIAEKMKERNDLVLISIKIRDGQTEVDQAYGTMLYRNGIPDVTLNRCDYQDRRNYREYTIKNLLGFAKAQPSTATVKVTGEYNEENRVLDITVSGKRNEDFIPLEGWTNLTVLLVEDSVLGYQAGSDLSPFYPHNGVIRKNVSAIWGDLVQWNGDDYEMSYSAKLNSGWNPKHMRVVAFLGKPFTGDNYDDIIVVNCNEYRIYNEYMGDVNGDHEVNIADINAVIGMILSGISEESGDTNRDGEVNIADINVIIDAVLNP